jgi:hypothetical protein
LRLAELGIAGSTTTEIVEQGNIREDMFRLLVCADLVIADISVHNANVFYELGIRHALRPRHTFMLRSNVEGHKYPFDLQTDRYLLYDAVNPAGDKGSAVEDLARALRSTIASPSPSSRCSNCCRSSGPRSPDPGERAARLRRGRGARPAQPLSRRPAALRPGSGHAEWDQEGCA